ncbi:MAG: AhpC/TSA family protein [Prevotellaceae bacterium]|jgi:thiol-disulfide isomerase/thioredoxin|nr:AhpC/TSA family protein [Prevotellaceae bacterium]
MKRFVNILAVIFTATIGIYAQDGCGLEYNIRPIYGEGKSFTIAGKAENMEGKNVMLCKVEASVLIPVDTAKVSKGSFTFSNKISGTMPMVIMYNSMKTFPLIVEPAKMEVVLDSENIENSRVKDSKTNDLYTEVIKTLRGYKEKLIDLEDKFQKYQLMDLINQDLYNQLSENQFEIVDQQNRYIVSFIEKHINENIAGSLLSAYHKNMPMQVVERLFNSFSDSIRNMPMMAQLDAILNADKVLVIGNPYIEVAMPNPAEDTVRLSTLIGNGNPTILFFWASWCNSCRVEIPYLVELRDKYRDKLNIMTVSADSQRFPWIGKLSEMKMDFNNVSDLKGFESSVFRKYYVQNIPFAILFDKEGKIAGKGSMAEVASILEKME